MSENLEEAAKRVYGSITPKSPISRTVYGYAQKCNKKQGARYRSRYPDGGRN
jgi:hypothetical protein